MSLGLCLVDKTPLAIGLRPAQHPIRITGNGLGFLRMKYRMRDRRHLAQGTIRALAPPLCGSSQSPRETPQRRSFALNARHPLARTKPLFVLRARTDLVGEHTVGHIRNSFRSRGVSRNPRKFCRETSAAGFPSTTPDRHGVPYRVC